MDIYLNLIFTLGSTVRLSVPIILACLAGLYSERAGIVVHHGDPVMMERGGQAVFADDEGGGTRLLTCQKARRGHRTGENIVGLGRQAEAAELEGPIAAGPLGVVSKKAEGDLFIAQTRDEAVGTGDELRSPIDHSIHIQ